jgi:hypothetical protein
MRQLFVRTCDILANFRCVGLFLANFLMVSRAYLPSDVLVRHTSNSLYTCTLVTFSNGVPVKKKPLLEIIPEGANG